MEDFIISGILRSECFLRELQAGKKIKKSVTQENNHQITHAVDESTMQLEHAWHVASRALRSLLLRYCLNS